MMYCTTVTRTLISSLIFLALIYATTPGALYSSVVSSQANVWDRTEAYSFGALDVIPIDTQYIRPDIWGLLDSLGADSVTKIFPGYNLADSLFTRADGKVVKLADLSKYYRIYFTGVVDWEDVQSTYNAIDTPSVVSAEQTHQADVVPNDPLFSGSGQDFLKSDSLAFANTNAVDAWEITKGLASQVIGIGDQGVQGDQPDLSGKVLAGVDMSDPAGQWDVDDHLGSHGTNMAGVMLAKTDNDTGIAGLNWNATVYSIKRGPSRPPESFFHADSVGLKYLNWSYGDSVSFPIVFQHDQFGTPLGAAAYNAWIKGMSIVASKGNDGIDKLQIPSDMSTVIGVGATLSSGAKRSDSNFGNDVRVVAHGTGLLTTKKDGSYGIVSGTSIATALVTATLSLIRATDTNLSADEAEEILYKTANDVEPSGYDDFTGFGTVNTGAAVTYAKRHTFIRMNGTWDDTVRLQDNVTLQFFDNYLGGLPTKLHPTRQFSARRTFDFSQYNFGHVPDILIRRRSTTGWELVSDSIREIAWAAVVPGTQTSGQVTVETGAYLASGTYWPCISSPPCPFPGGQFNSEIDIAITIAACSNPGDANNDCHPIPTIADVNYIVAWIFTGGPFPPIMNDADANGDCKVNIADVTYLIARIFSGGPAPLDNDCVPGSLKLTPGAAGDPSFAVTDDVSLDVVTGENGKRTTVIATNRNIHGLALFLRALNGSKLEVTNLTGVDMYWSQQGADVRIGLIDVTGKTYLSPKDTALLEITGDFEFVTVQGTEILADGTTVMFGPEFVRGKFIGESILPREISFDAIYPNPFNPVTNLAFSLPKDAEVTIEIYNILGQSVLTLTSQKYTAGKHTVQWNSQNDAGQTVASGV
ncbi:MAG: S8 family serine peptidase, partial [candidate division Zixibacteria bacterium]|nr:S8 family serine peptidase [candidate division Zixibacteria bacterium]